MATRPMWSAATLLHRLHDQQWTEEFRIGALDVPVAFSLSYDQLDAVGQRVFRTLGLHPGVSFDVAAAAALGGVGLHLAREVLDELVEVSLLNEGADGRYQLHDLLRQYAREVAMATDSPEEQRAAFARLVSYYLRRAGSAARLLDPGHAGPDWRVAGMPTRHRLITRQTPSRGVGPATRRAFAGDRLPRRSAAWIISAAPSTGTSDMLIVRS